MGGGGLNMTCMSHPLYDLTAVASPKSTDCCERLQQCGPAGKRHTLQLRCFLMALKRLSKGKPLCWRARAGSAICKYYFACLCQQRSQSICGKQYDMIYLFCYSEDVVG
ncbi:hypothetical protein ABG768_025893 [Culter alburnus]|uniref:Uncharacterized protein n=1 Tax=Culter alburnus TaxID=194366 RepID=A0AAW2AG14_CULAL